MHSGDLFDASRPPYPAMRVGARALAKLSQIAPTVVVSGNHDSGQLFHVLHELAGLAAERRLWFVSNPEIVEIPQLGDGFALAAVPFIPPALLTNLAVADLRRLEGNYADGVRQLNAHLLREASRRAGTRGIVVYAAHLYVHGAQPSRSERLITVGEDYAVEVETLGDAMYSAFGHIHDPQLLPGGTVTGRYAGSLVPVDFGERTQQKHVVVVELGDDVHVTERPLPGGRPLLQFDGTLDELEAKARDGQLDGVILKGRVNSDDPILDFADLVVEWAPDCAVFDLANVVARRSVRPITEEAGEAEEPPIEALFQHWRATAKKAQHKAPDDKVVEAFCASLAGGDDAGAALGASTVVALADMALTTFRSVSEV